MELPEIRGPDDAAALIRLIGVDFDPDRSAWHYTTPDGCPRFNDAQAAALNNAIARAGSVCEQAGVDLRDVARRVIDELRHGPWPSLADVEVLLMGGPVDGFACYGPLPDSDRDSSISGEETHDLRHQPWWRVGLDQLDLHPRQTLLHRVEVAMALLGDATSVATADDRPCLAEDLTRICWRLRGLQLDLN